MGKKGTNKWSNYGDGVQVIDVIFEVRELDRLRLNEGKDSNNYKKQHAKAVRLINLYNSEIKGGRGKFGLSISKTRNLISLKAGEGDFNLSEEKYAK